MNTGSDSTSKWACQWPIGLPHTTTVCGYLLPTPISVTPHVLYQRTGVWFLPTHLVDACICNRSFPLPEDFWLMYKLMYISCLLTVTSQSITYWYCLHWMWHWCCGRELSLLLGTIICINSCLTHWFVGIVQCLRGFVMYRVMYKDAHQYVADRDGVFYYVRRVPITRKFTHESSSFGLF